MTTQKKTPATKEKTWLEILREIRERASEEYVNNPLTHLAKVKEKARVFEKRHGLV